MSGQQGSWSPEDIGGLLALLPLGTSVLEPHLVEFERRGRWVMTCLHLERFFFFLRLMQKRSQTRRKKTHRKAGLINISV